MGGGVVHSPDTEAKIASLVLHGVEPYLFSMHLYPRLFVPPLTSRGVMLRYVGGTVQWGVMSQGNALSYTPTTWGAIRFLDRLDWALINQFLLQLSTTR